MYLLMLTTHWILYLIVLFNKYNSRMSVARNGIFSLKWRYYDQKWIFWTILVYSYFGIMSSYILYRDKRYRGLNVWIWNNRVIFHWHNGINGIYNFNPINYCGNYFIVLGTLVGLIWCCFLICRVICLTM